MDPNETLARIDCFLQNRKEGEDVDNWCSDLFDWIKKGGFAPTWEHYPLGTGYYRCRAVSMKKKASVA